MSEDNKANSSGDESTEKQDPIKQLKAEYGRKQDNVMNELNNLKSQLGQIADTVIHAAAVRNKQNESSEEVPDPVIDPKGYKDYMRKELRKEVDSSLSAERERTGVLTTLVNQYPELQSSDSELTQAALKIYNQLSNSEKSNPSGYKLAVMQAAQEVGVLPMNKRKSNNQSEGEEDFTLSSSNSSAPRKSQTRDKTDKIDDKTLEFARLLGRPTEDPKYVEKLKKTIASRKRSWSKFE